MGRSRFTAVPGKGRTDAGVSRGGVQRYQQPETRKSRHQSGLAEHVRKNHERRGTQDYAIRLEVLFLIGFFREGSKMMGLIRIGNVVAGFSPRSAFANQHCVAERTRAKARDYVTHQIRFRSGILWLCAVL